MQVVWDRSIAVAALARGDRRLARVLAAHESAVMPAPRRHDPFAYLLRAIVYQQISCHVARWSSQPVDCRALVCCRWVAA